MSDWLYHLLILLFRRTSFAKKAINILGGKIEKIDTFFLADTDMGRNIVSIKKQKGTPNKYPRKAGIPVKEPLK